jgi:hypothetical protein
MFGSFLPSLLVGFSTTNFTRAAEPTLSCNQLRSFSSQGNRYKVGLPSARVGRKITKVHDLFLFVAFLPVTLE